MTSSKSSKVARGELRGFSSVVLLNGEYLDYDYTPSLVIFSGTPDIEEDYLGKFEITLDTKKLCVKMIEYVL